MRNVTFFPSLEAAKSGRNEAVSKIYSGPDIDSINDDLFENLNTFLEEDLTVTNQILETLADYAINYEHQFYIEWLKDIKTVI